MTRPYQECTGCPRKRVQSPARPGTTHQNQSPTLLSSTLGILHKCSVQINKQPEMSDNFCIRIEQPIKELERKDRSPCVRYVSPERQSNVFPSHACD